MMLHRHFEKDKQENMTKLSDVTPEAKKETALKNANEAPKRGRKKKTEE